MSELIDILMDILGLVIKALSVIIPISLSLNQLTVLRKAKRTQFLRFLGEYHKPIGELLNYLKRLDTRPKEFGSILGAGFAFSLLFISVWRANNFALNYIRAIKASSRLKDFLETFLTLLFPTLPFKLELYIILSCFTLYNCTTHNNKNKHDNICQQKKGK